MSLKKLASGVALTVLASATASGQARAQAATASAPSVSGVTVTASETVTTAPAAPPLNTPYSVTTITSEAMRNLSPGATVNLQTLLVNQPSIFAYSNGPLGVGTSIFYRSFNSGQFAETFQGVPLNDIFNGGVTGQASTVNGIVLLPSNIDSVELYHGINNPAVNSYNSLGGTINYLPRLPTQEAGGVLGASWGSFNTFEGHGAINTGDIGGFRNYLAYSYGSSNGWVPQTATINQNVYYSGTYDPNADNHFGVILSYNHNDGHTPMQMPVPLLQQNGGFYQYPVNVAYEQLHDSRFMGILDFKSQLAPNITFDNKLYGSTNDLGRETYANPAFNESKTQPYELYNQGESSAFWLSYPNGPSYNPAKAFGSSVLGTDYHYYGYDTWAVGDTPTLTLNLPDNVVTVGGNVMYGALRSREYFYGASDIPLTSGFDAWDEHDSRLLASGYVQDEIHLLSDRLTLTPGLKYIFAHTTDREAIGFDYPYPEGLHDDESFLAPTIGGNYKVTDNLSINAAFGENIKFPDIAAYYNDVPGTNAPTGKIFTPTPQSLKPEHVNDYEAGIKYQLATLSAELNVYREDFTNTFIDAFNEATFSTVVSNGGSSRYQGVELRLLDTIDLQAWGALALSVDYSYNQANFTSTFHTDSVGVSLSNADALVKKGERVGDVPDSLASVGATWTYDGWRLSGQGRYIGKQVVLDYNTGVPDGVTIPDYFVMDIGLSKTVPLTGYSQWAKTVKFAINVDNLFNRYYYNYADTSTSENFFHQLTEFASPGAPRSIMGTIEVAF
jgi:iron complex outermembrane receptor protein